VAQSGCLEHQRCGEQNHQDRQQQPTAARVFLGGSQSVIARQQSSPVDLPSALMLQANDPSSIQRCAPATAPKEVSTPINKDTGAENRPRREVPQSQTPNHTGGNHSVSTIPKAKVHLRVRPKGLKTGPPDPSNSHQDPPRRQRPAGWCTAVRCRSWQSCGTC